MYTRKTTYTLISEAKPWTAEGCNTYALYNQGNTNVTINNILVLRPGQILTGPDEHPDVKDQSIIDIQFDRRNNPKLVQPDTGPWPIERSYATGDAVPDKDNRLVIIQTFISKD